MYIICENDSFHIDLSSPYVIEHSDIVSLDEMPVIGLVSSLSVFNQKSSASVLQPPKQLDSSGDVFDPYTAALA